jgi:putative tricarboxylic transport membrane protein
MMHIRSPKDFCSGLIFVAIGAAFVALAQLYRLGTLDRMGPGMFPTLMGCALALLGVAVVLRSLVVVGEPLPDFQARPLVVSLLAIVLFGVALQWLGLVAAIVALVLVGGYAAREARLRENIVLAAVMVLFSVGIFVWLLGLPLPLWPDS